MFHKQLVSRIQIWRHLTIVPNIYLILINTNLDWIAATVILMNNCIQQNLTECVLMKHKLLNSLDTLIINQCLHIFRVYQIYCLIYLLYQRTVHLILVHQIRIWFSKISDFDIRTCYPLLWIFIKRKHCCSYQISIFIN